MREKSVTMFVLVVFLEMFFTPECHVTSRTLVGSHVQVDGDVTSQVGHPTCAPECFATVAAT